ncbi:MAG TPA: PQQ-dependent sugar dehydrogenase [Cytophagaceae bacterium]
MKQKLTFFISALILIPILLFITSACRNNNNDELEDEFIIEGQQFDLQIIAEGLTSPVALSEPPDGSKRLFIVDQTGVIRIINPEGKLLEEPFLDIKNKLIPLNSGYDERGLLGFAFHPDYASNGRFFIYYSAPLRPDADPEWNHTAYLSEFRVSGNPDKADVNSEQRLLSIDQPQANNNGGSIAFGPTDNYLYLSLGDGGARDDKGLGHEEDWYKPNQGGNGQNIEKNLLGSILRIDVNSIKPYAIPPDNPFVDKPGMDEIYAFGFHNPYRFSFDKQGNHLLIVTDTGQELWEEINTVIKGGNYGWNVMEGAHCFSTENPESSPASCPKTDSMGNVLQMPVMELKNAHQIGGIGLAIIGGYVYRGKALPELNGQYLFGVWSRELDIPSGAVFKTFPIENGTWSYERIGFNNKDNGQLGHYLLGFGQDQSGEIYLLTSNNPGPAGNTGVVYKLSK